MLVTIYIDTDNQIPRRQLHRYGYVIEAKGHTVEGFGDVEDTFNGTVLTALMAALMRIRSRCELRICLRNCRVGRDLVIHMPKWRRSGWIGCSGKPVKNVDQWKQISNRLEQLQIVSVIYESMERHAYSSWIQAEIKRKIIT